MEALSEDAQRRENTFTLLAEPLPPAIAVARPHGKVLSMEVSCLHEAADAARQRPPLVQIGHRGSATALRITGMPMSGGFAIRWIGRVMGSRPSASGASVLNLLRIPLSCFCQLALLSYNNGCKQGRQHRKYKRTQRNSNAEPQIAHYRETLRESPTRENKKAQTGTLQKPLCPHQFEISLSQCLVSQKCKPY